MIQRTPTSTLFPYTTLLLSHFSIFFEEFRGISTAAWSGYVQSTCITYHSIENFTLYRMMGAWWAPAHIGDEQYKNSEKESLNSRNFQNRSVRVTPVNSHYVPFDREFRAQSIYFF